MEQLRDKEVKVAAASLLSEKQKEYQAKWERLLSCVRVNDLKKGCAIKDCDDKEDPRNPFQRDCDRITYSYPFRRMQNKTQVIPRPEIDFIHTRLTHSLEVATVGRSMGMIVEKYLLKEQYLNTDKYEKGSFSAIIAAACLAHDIGNPPFGHSGEDSISNYYRFDEGVKRIFYGNWPIVDPSSIDCSFLNEKFVTHDIKLKSMDLMRFEGNAMGFHLLTKYHEDGLNLTCATLAAFSKYPRQSYIDGDILFEPIRWAEGASQKKHGFFSDDANDFQLVAKEVGLVCLETPNGELAYRRHPLAFLVEAADDICYTIIDLEDGFRFNLIPFNEFEETLLKIAREDNRFDSKVYIEQKKRGDKKAFTYLRSLSINYLIQQVMNVFTENFDGIMSGQFDEELIKKTLSYTYLKELKENYVKKYVYQWREVLEIEAAGFEIIGKLLHEFTVATDLCVECAGIGQNAKAKKLDQLLPEEFKNSSDDIFKRYLRIATYIAGMSDTYALDIYRKITGFSLR